MTEEQAIANILRVRSMGQEHITIYSYVCDECGGLSWSHRVNRKCCSPECAIKYKPGITNGAGNPRWKGGRIKQNGYIKLSGMWDHPHHHPTQGTVLEHRVVMERALGRFLNRWENVHHKNGIKDDNRADNLELWATPQPYGQRVKDLVAWVVDNYESDVRTRLDVVDAVNAVLNSSDKPLFFKPKSAGAGNGL